MYTKLIYTKNLDNGVFDFAIVAVEPHHEEKLLWEEKLFWIKSKKFNIDNHKKLPIANFSDDCIIHNYTMHSMMYSKLDFNIIYQSSVLSDLMMPIKDGIAISLMPEFLISENVLIIKDEKFSNSLTFKLGYVNNIKDNKLASTI